MKAPSENLWRSVITVLNHFKGMKFLVSEIDVFNQLVRVLQDMIDCDLNAIIIKTAALGMDPLYYLGRNLKHVQLELIELVRALIDSKFVFASVVNLTKAT